MDTQENQQDPRPAIEDLTVNDEDASEVKGGSFGDGSVRTVRDSIVVTEW